MADFNRDSKTFDEVLDFTRASEATFIGSDGLIQTAAVDAPRFDHDPVTGEALGLLIEEQRTNLLTYSNPDAGVPTDWIVAIGSGTFTHTLTSATWIFASGQNAIRNQQTVSGRSHIRQIIPLVAGQSYVFSVYFDLENSEVTSGTEQIISTNGDITYTDGSASNGALLSDADESGRIVRTFTANSNGDLIVNIGVGAFNDATGGVTFTAPQLEEGAYPTSYIKTEGSQVTRAADSCTRTLGSEYNENEVTAYAEGSQTAEAGSLFFLNFQGSLNNHVRVGLPTNADQALFFNESGGSNVSIPLSEFPSYTVGDYAKVAASLTETTLILAINGESAQRDISARGLPVFDSVRLGGIALANNVINSNLANFRLYPRALTQSELEALTA